MNNDISLKVSNNDVIKELVYEIRGEKVMLDYDLAALYGYEVKRLNEQVKRNINRFPDDFMFQLTKEEIEFVKSQIATTPIKGFFEGQEGGRRKPPYAFTEQGIYQLATVLKGETAEQTSILIMRVFREMRIFIKENQNLLPSYKFQELENKTYKLDERLQNVEEKMVSKADLSEFMKVFNDNISSQDSLILNGKLFTADIAYQNIYKKAKKNIIIIDDYLGIKTLEHLTCVKNNIKVTIISDNKGKSPLKQSEYDDFIKEYRNIHIDFIKTSNKVHDRYIVIDNNTKNMKVYHSGASSKDAGKAITTILEIKDINEYKTMIKKMLLNNQLKLK